MNEEAARVALVAAMDQQRAAYRDYAGGCRVAFDEFIRQEFTRGEAMELLHRLLDGLEARCDAST